MVAFATYVDLATRLKRTFTSDEQDWVTALLEDAADYMRGVMRNQVYPSAQSTYTAYLTGGWARLPQGLVRSVDSVTSTDGLPVVWKRREDSVQVTNPVDAVLLTFTYGLDAAPSDLKSINCALAAQMILTVEAGIGLTAGGLSSIAIDDFKASFADGGVGTGMSLTDATRQYLIDHYGQSAWVVGSM